MSNIERMQELNDKVFNNTMEINTLLEVATQLPVNQKPETLVITPSKDGQGYIGLYDKVSVYGDSDLVSENIKEGVNIFGVEGSAKTTDAKITNCSRLFHDGCRLDNVYELLALCENVTDMSNMFYNCKTLTELDVSNFDTSNVTTMKSMFYNCSSLASLDASNFNTSNVTDMSTMFYNCSSLASLDVSNFDTGKVTIMNTMFYGCDKLTSLDLSSFDTSNVTTMSSMFNGSGELTELDLSNFDTSKVTDMSNMFRFCDNLISLDISNFDFGKVYNINYILDLNSSSKLTNLKFGINLGKGYTQQSANYSSYKLDISYSKKLTHESLMSIINNLYDLNLTYDVANGGTLYRQELKLGTTNKAKLTAEEIAIATNKGWNVT